MQNLITQQQTEMNRKFDMMMGKLEKMDRGKTIEFPQSSVVTPTPSPVAKGNTSEGTNGGNTFFGTPVSTGMIFGSYDGTNQGKGDQGKGRYDYKHRKVDMPLFNGSDPDGWILLAERYFAIYQLINEKKLEAAILSLSGDALSWYRWSDRSIAGGDLYEQWSSLEQTGTTGDYICRFVELAAPLDGVTEHVALGNFIRGLKPIIKNELRLWGPDNLNRAMDLAQQLEEKNRDIRNSGYGALGARTQTLPVNRSATTYYPNPNGNTQMGGFQRQNDRRLTESQIQDKRSRGLCYKCDDKWFKGHRCKFQVNVILIEDEEDDGDREHTLDAGEDEGKQALHEPQEKPELAEVTLNSVAGLSSPKTMKLEGRVWEQPVITLVDPGATHNFIFDALVERLGLPVTDTGAYGVRMGTGDTEVSLGVCRGVLLQLQNVDIVEEFLPLRLGSSDVILGLQWLETLGNTKTNWKDLTMEFELGGQPVKLVGDPSLGRSQITLKAMERELKRGKGGLIVEFNNSELENKPAIPTPRSLQRVIDQYQLIFSEPMGLPPQRHIEHQITLEEGTPPISVRPYRYPYFQKTEIERMIRDMLADGIIQPSISPYSSPVILVKKKDKSWRFCVDYRALNRVTIPDKFPIPVIDELLDELYGSVMFNKLDLRSGYHQIRVKTDDIPKTAFRTHDGHYEFRVMPFGLTNAPATFQSLMNEIFRPYLRKFILVFFDDILIYSKSEDLYNEHVATALEVLKQHQLFLNLKKCEFGQVKKAMTTVPVLAMPDYSKEFVVETDASGFGLGAVLMQQQRPVAYYSCNLGTRDRMKSIYEKELMAIVKSVLKWRLYLIGRKFTVRTDQLSLKYLLEQRIVGSDYQKWISKLMGFSFDIQYRTGSSNRVADALSRRDDGPTCDTLTVTCWKFWEQLKHELERDEFFSRMKTELHRDPSIHKGFSIYQNNLFYKGRLVLPSKSHLHNEVIREFHDTPIGGHAVEYKTYKRVASEVFWTGMKAAVTDYVKHCSVCQQNKTLTLSPAGLLQPIPLPSQTWDEITMDFIEWLPRSRGWDTIWVVVERLSKYAHFIPLRHPFTAATVAQNFMKEVVRLHGLPLSIISDRDRIFLSQFWVELFRLHGVELKRSTAYHPQTDGQSEVVNRCLETYLCCFCSDKPKQWAQWLSWAEFCYNKSFHTATRFTPFKALYVRDPPPLIRYEGQYTPIDTLEQQLENRDATLDELRMNLLTAQPYRQKSLAKRSCEKLAPRFYGPFQISRKIGKVAYKLELPEGSLIRPVFHVSQLRTATGSWGKTTPLPPQLNAELELLVQPESIRGLRFRKGSSTSELEVLIQWQGLHEDEAT
ncbi:hypothetical protein LXL04_028859 [Taraxacum kok-saghyz]